MQHSHLEFSNENMWKELNSGIAPEKIYQQPSHSNATFSEPTKTLTSSSIYGAVYSGVPVYEMMCRNVVRTCHTILMLGCHEKKG